MNMMNHLLSIAVTAAVDGTLDAKVEDPNAFLMQAGEQPAKFLMEGGHPVCQGCGSHLTMNGPYAMPCDNPACSFNKPKVQVKMGEVRVRSAPVAPGTMTKDFSGSKLSKRCARGKKMMSAVERALQNKQQVKQTSRLGAAMPEIRACMFDRDARKQKVPDAMFNRMVEELKREERKVMFVGQALGTAYGTTIPEKTEVDGGRIFCGIYVPTRLIKFLERGGVCQHVGFAKPVIVTPAEIGMTVPEIEPHPSDEVAKQTDAEAPKPSEGTDGPA